MKNAWKLLDWNLVCELAPEIHEAHRQKSERFEYGLSFYDFIYDFTDENLEHHVQNWWDSLTESRRIELLREREDSLRRQLSQINRLWKNLR